MTVKIYPDVKGKSNAILRFFRKNRISCELVQSGEINVPRTHRLGELPAVEIDGKVFVNPNDDALKKILRIA